MIHLLHSNLDTNLGIQINLIIEELNLINC